MCIKQEGIAIVIVIPFCRSVFDHFDQSNITIQSTHTYTLKVSCEYT